MRNQRQLLMALAAAAVIAVAMLLAGIPQRAFRGRAADRQEQNDAGETKARVRSLNGSRSRGDSTPKAENARGEGQRSRASDKAAAAARLRDADAITISGSVLTAEGAPLGDALVILTQSPSADADQRSAAIDETLAEARSDTQGRYSLTLTTAPVECMLNASKDGYAPSVLAFDRRSKRTAEADLVLHSVATLQGQVNDASGKPISDAVVSASHASLNFHDKQSEGSVTVQTWSTTTTATGEFELTDLPADELRMEISKAEFVPQERAVRAPARSIRFAMHASGGEVQGYVFRLHGDAIASATVRLISQGNPQDPTAPRRSWTTASDKTGEFRIAGLPDGIYQVSAAKDGLLLAPGSETPGSRIAVAADAPVTDLKLFLYPGHRIKGRVIGVEFFTTGPLEGAEVTAMCASPRKAITDEDGNFDLTGLGADESGNWLPLRIRKRGYELLNDPPNRKEMVQAVRLDPDKPEITHDIELRKPMIVTGRVVNELGAGIPTAIVENDDTTSTVDAAGQFSVTLRPNRNTTIRATAPDFAAEEWHPRTPVASELANIEITMHPDANVSGKVVDEADEPIADANVQVLDPNQPYANPDSVPSGPDGQFSLTGVRSGALRLRAWKFGYIQNGDQRIELRGGETLTGVKAVLCKPRKLAGIVTDSGGRPLEKAQVQCSLGKIPVTMFFQTRKAGFASTPLQTGPN